MQAGTEGEDTLTQGMEVISEKEEQRSDDNLHHQSRNISASFQETVEI